MANFLIAAFFSEGTELSAAPAHDRKYLRVLFQPRPTGGNKGIRFIGRVAFEWTSGPDKGKTIRHIVAFPEPVFLEVKNGKLFVTNEDGESYEFGVKTRIAPLFRMPRHEILRRIMDASGIQDHDFWRADEAYLKWKRHGARKADKPKPWKGGELDAFRGDGQNFCCLVEAFEHAARGLRTWKDIDEQVIPLLRDTPGFEHARIPDDESFAIMMEQLQDREERPSDSLPPLPPELEEPTAYDDDDPWLTASADQENFLGYDLSNDESFWLSQVAEDGSLPSPKDKALAEKLKKKGLVDVYERPKTRRDTSLNQVYFVTYRGDAAQRAYQTYRARWAKTDASVVSGNALTRIEASGWAKLTEDQKLNLLAAVFTAIGLDEWEETADDELPEGAGADDVLDLFRTRLSNDYMVDKYIPWLVNKIKKEGDYSTSIGTLIRSFRAICIWASETNTDIGKVSLEEALEKAERYIPRAAKKALEDSDANPVVYRFADGYKVVQLKTDEALKLEGDRMKHCVGTYCGKVKEGTSVIYSLRSPKGDPEKDVTLEYAPNVKRFTQMFGPGNRKPKPEQQKYLIEFIEAKFPYDKIGLLLAGKPAKDIDLRGADLRYANLTGANLGGANLYGADLRYAILRYAILTGANLYGADLRGANLYGANLYGADLRSADLGGANLEGANLEGADLSGADLRSANLEGADLSGADLEGAILTGANLRGANLRGANLRGAYLRSANLTGANLEGANLTGANLEKIIYNDKTIWPEGFTPPQSE
jgi:hypothetical protein